MRSRNRFTWLAAAMAAGLAALAPKTEAASPVQSVLQHEVDLSGARSAGTRYFDMTTALMSIESNGTRGEAESLRVQLQAVPTQDSAGPATEYTCRQFLLVKANGTRVSIPALSGWTHLFRNTANGLDAAGQVFGIDHSKFQHLVDSAGEPLEASESYLVYNTFVDFHAFCDEFASPTREGHGIQDLKRIGQIVVHAAANSKPSTSLRGQIQEGSFYQNGQITLSLKGLSLVNDSPCALVSFDSGESSFRMAMEPVPGMQVETVGGSHYYGDIHVDLETRWPRLVQMRELIVSETRVPMSGSSPPRLIHSIQERGTTVRSVTRAAFERD